MSVRPSTSSIGRLLAARRWVVVVLAAVLAAALSTSPIGSTRAGAADGRPNIVLITSDDQSVDDLQYMPYTQELIGAAGVTFTDAIAPNPLCCPARATILTGQLSHNNGVRTNVAPYGGYAAMRRLNPKALPVWMSRAGYHTAFIGKYLNGYPGRDKTEVPDGWRTWQATVEGLGSYNYYGATLNENGRLVDRSGEYQTAVFQALTERSIIAGAQSDRPFFVWQSNLAPHGACWPRTGPGCRWGPPMPASEDAGKFNTLPLGTADDPSFNERVVADKPAHIRRLRRWTPRRITQTANANRARVRTLQAVDRNVRDTVELLAELGELDNTLVIFASDNGYLQGQHRYVGKILPYEPSLAVPLLMRGPGIPAGAVRSETAALVDVAPTVADAADAKPLLRQDGRSLLPLATGSSTTGYDALSIETGPPIGSSLPQWMYQGVRTGRYTYVEYLRTGERELYDRQVDPYQLTNVASRPSHAATRRALAAKLAQLRQCRGVACRNVSGPVPPPSRSAAPVHPDELASAASVDQVVTLTASGWASGTGQAVAWQRSGMMWRIARGPFAVEFSGRGLVPVEAYRPGTGETPAGVFKSDSSANGSRAMTWRIAGSAASLILQARDQVGIHGWVSMEPRAMRWLQKWMRPQAAETTLVVGTPAYLRDNL